MFVACRFSAPVAESYKPGPALTDALKRHTTSDGPPRSRAMFDGALPAHRSRRCQRPP
jgi:hypothetical protein